MSCLLTTLAIMALYGFLFSNICELRRVLGKELGVTFICFLFDFSIQTWTYISVADSQD